MGEGGAAGLRPSEGEQVSGSILRLLSALPTGRFYRPVRVSWRPGQPPEEPRAFQGWVAGPIALLHSLVGRERPWEAPLRPHGTDGFQSGVQGLQPALLSRAGHGSRSQGPRPALSSPPPPLQEWKESENFHSNLALQVIMSVFCQGRPTERILFNSLLVCLVSKVP